MIKRLSALMLALLLTFLCACGEKEPLIDTKPDKEPEHQEQDVPSEPEKDEKEPIDNTASVTLINEYTELVDTSFLKENNMVIEAIFPVSDDMLFVFTTQLTEGRPSEQVQLWPYSLERAEFTGDMLPVGIVGQYPDKVFTDGTVMAATLNTETYEYQSLLFIDINTLECEEISLAHIKHLRGVNISPDKAHAALSTQEGAIITEMDLATVVARYDGYIPEGGDPDLDYHLPYFTGWLPDGSGAIGKVLGWEWVYHPFTLSLDGSLCILDEYEFLTALPYGERLVYFDHFSGVPKGTSLPDGSNFTEDTTGISISDDGTSYISYLMLPSKGNVIAAAETIMTEESSDCTVSFYRDGESFRSLELHGNINNWASIDYIALTPDGESALLLTCATIEAPRHIYRVSLK
ncbi:MAG: hypothetical protein IIW34_08340 [Clostridia bacterium]|nr:hypothetical protein [Clostridia bacterium]